MPRLASEVHKLVRVGPAIIKLVNVVGVVDVRIVIGCQQSHRVKPHMTAMKLAVGAVGPVVRRCPALKQGQQRTAMARVGLRPAGDVEECREQINEVMNVCIGTRPASDNTRPADDKWYEIDFLVHGIVLVTDPVRANRVAVVTGEDHKRIVGEALCIEMIEHAAKRSVDHGDLAEIDRDQPRPFRPWQILRTPVFLLDALHGGLAVEWIGMVRPGRNFGRIVHRSIGFRHDVREVGPMKVQPHKERRITI